MDARHYDPQRLKELREKSGKTQEQIARLVKRKRLTISRAERGESASYDLLCRLAKRYRVPVVSILRSDVQTGA